MVKSTESKIGTMTEHLERGLHYIGKAMECLEELGARDSYPEKGGMDYRYPAEDDYDTPPVIGFRRNRRM